MAAIIEDYCSYEVAKLLKEKGFDENCLKVWIYSKSINLENNAQLVSSIYFMEGELIINNADICRVLTTEERYEDAYICPTLQMAMKWLREVQGLFVSIGNDDLDYNWQIFDINDRTKDLDPTCLTESYAGYRKYEQACEAAIKYCLEYLI